MAEPILAHRPLRLEGNNLAENWRRWRQQYELYITATEKDSKSEKLQCATFLALAGEAAIDVFNKFSISTAEKDKIKPLIEKFEEYCTPKRNVTFERHVFNSRRQKVGEAFDPFVTDLKILVKKL